MASNGKLEMFITFMNQKNYVQK
nr:unnamed protein product [Callosobruchus analis]